MGLTLDQLQVIGEPTGAFPRGRFNFSTGAQRPIGQVGDTDVGQVDVRTPEMRALEVAALPFLAQVLQNPLSIAGGIQQAIGTPPGAAGFGILNPAMQQLSQFQPASNDLTSLLFGGSGALPGFPGFEGGQQPGGGVFPSIGGAQPSQGPTTPTQPPAGGTGPGGNGANGNPRGGQGDGGSPPNELLSPIGGGGGALPLAAFGSMMGAGGAPVFAGGPNPVGGAVGANPLDPNNPLNGLINPPQAGDFPFPSAGPGSLAQQPGLTGVNDREAIENAQVQAMFPNNPFLGPPAAASAPDPQIKNVLDLIQQLATNTGVDNQTAFNRSNYDTSIPGLLEALAGIGVVPGGASNNVGQAPKVQNNQILHDLTGFQARADGGDLDPNAFTLVGEAGPELIPPGNNQVIPLAATAGPGNAQGPGFNPGGAFANVMAAAAPLTGTPILGATDGGAGSANPNNPGLGPQQPGGTGSLPPGVGAGGGRFVPQLPAGGAPNAPTLNPLPGQSPPGGAPGTGAGNGGTPAGGGAQPGGSAQGLLAQMLQAPAPEGQVFNRAFNGGLGNQLDTNPGQGVVDALQPLFQRNLTDSLGQLRNTTPSIFNSATVLEGTDLARRANQDFNMTAAQALLQGAGLQQGAAQTLGGLAGQAGNNPFNRALGAGQQALQLRGQDLGQQLGLLQLGQQQQQFLSQFGLAQNQQAFNQTINPTMQLLMAALGIAQPTAFQTVAAGG